MPSFIIIIIIIIIVIKTLVSARELDRGIEKKFQKVIIQIPIKADSTTTTCSSPLHAQCAS